MDASLPEFSPVPSTGRGLAVSIQEIYPPQTLPVDAAERISLFAGGPVDPRCVTRLTAEPKQNDSFALVARVEWRVVGYMKLQYGKIGEVWIRSLVAAPPFEDDVHGELVDYAAALIGPKEFLITEVAEGNTASQLELRRLGLRCQPPWQRSKRQRDAGRYEFRSVALVQHCWQGARRFSFPRSASDGGR